MKRSALRLTMRLTRTAGTLQSAGGWWLARASGLALPVTLLLWAMRWTVWTALPWTVLLKTGLLWAVLLWAVLRAAVRGRGRHEFIAGQFPVAVLVEGEQGFAGGFDLCFADLAVAVGIEGGGERMHGAHGMSAGLLTWLTWLT